MQKWIYKNKNKKGFTLIELVVVIAILGILAAIAIPRFGSIRKTAELKANNSTAAIVGKAAEAFMAEQNDYVTVPILSLLGNYLDGETSARTDITVTLDSNGNVIVVGPGTGDLQGKYPLGDS